MIQNAPEPLSVNNDVPPPNEWRTSLRQNLNFPGTNSQFADTGLAFIAGKPSIDTCRLANFHLLLARQQIQAFKTARLKPIHHIG